ncbi:hypothetical protein BAUCODRAFT_144667 [Baudoinia panamericana UAMH 10762]|uniref:Magnesium transporter n=1 Tax=Baudoinia panamericana (strain UAMH 10762) TaxID=717646 RepID=M2NQ15_BAUPA|nr:uncharacterized protein BAUCODRAFT_144667 [Baudoinia panamericana UAMH 10762]EMD01096.1 hypothetical protein BAUCODRAFT_144667 [Baudoinia panamericana UAMH 10762]
MAIASIALNVIGVIFLSHAVYSAYEHSLLPSTSASPSSGSYLLSVLDPKVNLPVDITIETLVSVVLLCAGVVLSSANLKPIQWNVWAGNLERSKDARATKEVGVGGGNPYAALEERSGFLDIRGEMKGFAEWKNKGGEGRIEGKKA